MSTDFDDALVDPSAAGLPDRFFDRLMFNLHPTDATTPSVILGAGLYPTRNVIDGFVVVTDAERQRNLRLSTELSSTDGSGVGPVRWLLLDPHERWRLRVAPNPTGLELDVVWQARTPPWHGRVSVANGDAPASTFEHLFQSGRYSGWMSLDGERVAVDGWYGQRDRSRGVRTMSGGQGLHLWVQAQFDDRSIGFLLVEGRDGSRLLLEGAVMLVDGTLDPIVDVAHDLRFTGDLDLDGGRLAVSTERGHRYDIRADASAGGGFMAGAGYGGHHGEPKGLDHVEFDVYPLDGSVTPKTVDTALTDRLTAFEWNAQHGVGVFEFAHSRSSAYRYRASLPSRIPPRHSAG